MLGRCAASVQIGHCLDVIGGGVSEFERWEGRYRVPDWQGGE